MTNPVIDPKGHRHWYNSNGDYHREDGPAYISVNGTQEWHINGDLHRIDSPAIIDADGHKEWWVDGVLHRKNGPAIIYSTGRKAWYVNGILYIDNESFQKAANLTDEDMLMITLKYGSVK